MSNRITIFFYLFCVLAITSCNTTKYLGEDEYLLGSNSIKLKSKEKIRNKPSLKYQLSELYRQKKNSRFFFVIPREWIYYRTSGEHDTTKLDKWQRRVLAEPPTIYNDSLSELTAQKMKEDLQKRGFYNAIAYHTKYFKGKKAYVTYHVDPQKQLTVNDIQFSSRDGIVAQELNNIKEETFYKKGAPVADILYPKERERIRRHMKNNGFFDFLPNYVAEIEADTFVGPQLADLYLDVTLPHNDSIHQIYTIGEIKVFPNYSPIIPDSLLKDTLIDGYRFVDTTFNFYIKPKALANAILLQTGDIYSLTKREQTDRRLNALGISKFVRIRPEIDSVKENVINYTIALSPNKKMEMRLDFELNYTNRNSAARTGNLFGITLGPTLRNRNFLRGAELLVTNLSGGVEFDPGLRGSQFWNTIDLGIQSELFFPRFIDYFGFWRFADKLRVRQISQSAAQAFLQSITKQCPFQVLRQLQLRLGIAVLPLQSGERLLWLRPSKRQYSSIFDQPLRDGLSLPYSRTSIGQHFCQ